MLESNSMRGIISYFLSQPFIFNNVRKTIAGNQENTKNFVRRNLQAYKAKTVLDIGCGTGDFVEAVPKQINYVGIDINEKFISFAQTHYQNEKRKFLVQNIIKNNFHQGKKFDATLFISMFHHLSDNDLKTILPIIRSVTKKIIIVADIIPDPDGILRKIMVKLDQGKFVRLKEVKINILCKYFKVAKTEIIPSKLAIQFGIICEV